MHFYGSLSYVILKYKKGVDYKWIIKKEKTLVTTVWRIF